MMKGKVKMKILAISDTHGELGKVYEVYRSIKDVDMILHMGDYLRDAEDLNKRIDVPVIGVKGNCDGALRKEDCTEIVETEAGKILMTHGHVDGVNYDITNLVYRGMEEEARIILFGHTHIPYLENTDDLMIMNPGSLTRPRDGSYGSYGIIEINGDSVHGEIIYYKKPYKAKGGYIKGLINYSDRF